MGAVVYLGLWLENAYVLLAHNVFTVILLVSLGAAVYFLILLAISDRFRATVGRNLPGNIL